MAGSCWRGSSKPVQRSDNPSLLWRAAELLQTLPALLPDGGVEDANVAERVGFAAGDDFRPYANAFRIARRSLRETPKPRCLVCACRQRHASVETEGDGPYRS